MGTRELMRGTGSNSACEKDEPFGMENGRAFSGGHLKSQRRKNLRFSKLNELGEPQFPHLKTEVNGIPPDCNTGRRGGLGRAHAFLSFAFAGLSAKKARPLCLLVKIPWVHHTRTSMPTGEAPFRGPLRVPRLYCPDSKLCCNPL